MDINWTIVASVAIAVIGWIVTHRNQLRHEVFKLRLQRRLAMFDALFPALGSAADVANANAPKDAWADTLHQLSEARLALQVYGYRREREAFEALIGALERADAPSFSANFREMVATAKANIRRELNLPVEG